MSWCPQGTPSSQQVHSKGEIVSWRTVKRGRKDQIYVLWGSGGSKGPTAMSWITPPKKSYFEVLILRPCEGGLLWKQSHGRCDIEDEVVVEQGGPRLVRPCSCKLAM